MTSSDSLPTPGPGATPPASDDHAVQDDRGTVEKSTASPHDAPPSGNASVPQAQSASPSGLDTERDDPLGDLGAPSTLVRGLSGTDLIVSVLGAISVMMVIWNLQDASLMNANTGSRYATIHSLVDFGTFVIDDSPYVRTPDKIKPNGHFTSSKPPLLPTYGAAVYWVYQKLTGNTILEHEGSVVWLVGLMTGVLGHALLLLYFYRLSKLLLRRQLAIIISFCAAAFAWLGVSFATAINNHSPAATLLVVGFYYAYLARNHKQAGALPWLLSGLCFGILPAIDLPSGALSACAGLYLLTADWKRCLLLFVPAALPGLASQLILCKLATGSYLPAYLNTEAKGFEGDYLSNRRGIDALREPKHVYAFHVLLGHHGVFSMTPIFLFGLYELCKRSITTFKTAFGSSFRRLGPGAPERLFLVGCLVITLSFYIFRTRTYGGWTVGMRWLVPVMPVLLFYFGKWLDRVRISRALWGAVVVAFMVSCFNVQDGLSSPFQFSMWNNFLQGTPNRNRVGKKMNLGKLLGAKKSKKSKRSRHRSSRREKAPE